MKDRHRRRAAARRARLRQGAPGGALVPRPPGRLDHGRRGAGLMLNLDDPEEVAAFCAIRHHQVAIEHASVRTPRKYDRAEHEYPKELDMLAALMDGMASSGETSSAAGTPQGVKRDAQADGARTPVRRARRQARRRQHVRLRSSRSSRRAGATSRWCCRCLARVSATLPSPRWPTTSSPSASPESGPRWRSPNRASARTRPPCRPPRSATAMTTS